MLTSFFSTSKPINTIAVILYMTVAFWISQDGLFTTDFSGYAFAKACIAFAIYVFTMFVLNFISRKNDLSKRNTYKVILFAAFTASIPGALKTLPLLASGLFIMLALRRIMSLRSGKEIDAKLFDAGTWIAVAILCYFWSWVYIVVLILALMFFAIGNIRQWFLPLLGIGCVAIFSYCYVLYHGDGWTKIVPENLISFDFEIYSEVHVLIASSFLLSIFLWSVWPYVQQIQNKRVSQRPAYRVVIALALVSLLPIIFTASKNGGELYFFTFPLAIIVTYFIESAKDTYFKEALLWSVLILPVIIHIL